MSIKHHQSLVSKFGFVAAGILLACGCTGGDGTSNPVSRGGATSSEGGSANAGSGGASSSDVDTQAGSGGDQLGGSTAATGGSSSLTSGGTTASGGRSTSAGGASTSAKGGATSTSMGTSPHWVGTWTASPYAVPSGNMPPSPLGDSVMRQVVHVSLGGSQLRVLFSNFAGNGPVTIKSAHLAVCKASPAVDSTIDTTTDKALAFAGSESVTIEKGKEIWSDPIDFTIAAQGNISITTAFGTVPTTLSGHAGARTTSYQIANSTNVSAANMTSAQTVDSWYFISGIDVMADATASGAVAIGDSITDGRGTDTNKNNRWTDILAARLHANAATANVAVMNQGIGATNLVGTYGTAAEARFNRDVLSQSGVRYAIVYDGVNDIGGNATFAAMKTVYDKMISLAHAKGLLIYGGTILPFGANSYYTVDREAVRQQVNAYIRSGVFDGYIDFDAALTDNATPPKLQTVYATWAQTDGLHPGPAGYQKMGDTPDLSLFTK